MRKKKWLSVAAGILLAASPAFAAQNKGTPYATVINRSDGETTQGTLYILGGTNFSGTMFTGTPYGTCVQDWNGTLTIDANAIDMVFSMHSFKQSGACSGQPTNDNCFGTISADMTMMSFTCPDPAVGTAREIQ